MIGYFNVPNFCDIYSFKYPIKEPTHYEYSMNVKCIDFMLTDRLRCFQSICEIEKRLSDFYKITATVLKSYVKKKKQKRKSIPRGTSTRFTNDKFKSCLYTKSDGDNSHVNSLDSFLANCKRAVDKTLKKKPRKLLR